MNSDQPSSPAAIILLVLAIVSLNGTVLAFGWGLSWPARIGAAALSLALWLGWLAMAARAQRADAEGGTAAAISGGRVRVLAAMLVLMVASVFLSAWGYVAGNSVVWAVFGLGAAAMWAGSLALYHVWLSAAPDAGRPQPLSPPDAAQKRFLTVHAPFVVGFVAAVWIGARLARRGEGLIDIAAAALPIVILAAWIWEFTLMLRRADEMVRAIQHRALAISCGAVLAGAVAWNVVQMMLGWPPLPPLLLAPAWAVAYGIAISAEGGGAG